MFGCTIAVCCLALSLSLSHSCSYTLFFSLLCPFRSLPPHSLPIYTPFVRFQMHFLPQTVSNLSVLPPPVMPPLPSIHSPLTYLVLLLLLPVRFAWSALAANYSFGSGRNQMPSRPLRKGCMGKVGRAGRLEGRLAVCVKSMLAQHFIGQWPTLAKQLNSLFLPLSGGGVVHTGRMSVLCNLFIPAKQCTLISCFFAL